MDEIHFVYLYMVSIQTFKKALGTAGKHLSEQEVEKQLAWQYQLANALFDLWQHKTKVTTINSVTIVSKENGNCVTIFNFVEISVYA